MLLFYKTLAYKICFVNPLNKILLYFETVLSVFGLENLRTSGIVIYRKYNGALKHIKIDTRLEEINMGG